MGVSRAAPATAGCGRSPWATLRRQHRHRRDRRRRPADRLRPRLPDLAALHRRVVHARTARSASTRRIEFGNRMLTFVLVAVAVATFVAAWQTGRRDAAPRSRCVLALGVPAQAVIGGITVLTDLNPWVVSFHLLVLAGDHRRRACCSSRRLDAPGPGRGRRRRRGRPGLADVRRRLGRAVRRHRGHRLRPARRRPRLAAQRARPAPGQPAARRRGVPASSGSPSGCCSPCAPSAPPGGARAVSCCSGSSWRQGADRLRAVLHRPADRAGRLPHARRRADLGRGDLGAAADAGPRDVEPTSAAAGAEGDGLTPVTADAPSPVARRTGRACTSQTVVARARPRVDRPRRAWSRDRCLVPHLP